MAAVTSNPEQQATELARIGGTSNVALVVVPFFLIAVVGILAAIAIPAYQDYTIRAQVSEGLNLSGGAKAAVTEFILDTNELPRDNADLGLDDPGRIVGSYVSSVAVYDGTIVVTYGRQANPLLSDKTLELSPSMDTSGAIVWGCSSPTIENKHLPAACR